MNEKETTMNRKILTKRLLVVAALALAVTQAAVAGDLTLDEARKLALSSSRTLAKSALAVESAAVDETLQLYESLPSLSASATAGATPVSASGAAVADTVTAGATLSLSQTIWNGGKNGILSAIDSLASGIAKQTARAAYFDALDAIDAAWYGLLEAEATRDAAASAIEVAEVSLSIAKIKLDAGALSMTDYLEAESTLESNRATLSQAKRDVAIYGAKVASLTGLASAPTAQPVDFADYDALIARLAAYTDSDVEAFVARLSAAVTAGNPDLASADLSAQKSGKSVSLAAADYLPSLSLGLSGGLDYAASSAALTPSAKVSLSASVSLDAWKTAASVKGAKIAESQAKLDLAETTRTVDIDVRTSAYECVAQAQSVVSTAKALEYAKKHYESEFELYKLSSASVSDLSDAAALVSTNSKQWIAARYGFLSCLSDIRSLAAFSDDAQVRELIK
jgi:outer membrane protein